MAFTDKLRVSKVQPCLVLPQDSNRRKMEALFPSELCFSSKDSYTLPSKELHSGGRHAHDFSVVYPRWRAGTHTHVLCSPASSELSDKITHRLLTYTTCDPHLSGLPGVLGWSQHQKYNPCLLVLQAPFPGSSALPVFIFSSLSGVVTASSFVFVPVEVTAASSRGRF